MKYTFNWSGSAYSVETEAQDKTIVMKIDNTTHTVEDIECRENLIDLRVDGIHHNIYYARARDKLFLAINGDCYSIELKDDSKTKKSHGAVSKGDSVSSPMPGVIVKIPIEEGDEVKAGETLVIVEAMKMQNELRSPRDGVVGKVNFKEGQQIDALQLIVELKPGAE
jgi:acetyl/propionyl-CoA carboxylase alpha subunit